MMFDLWPVYSGERFRASWPPCFFFFFFFLWGGARGAWGGKRSRVAGGAGRGKPESESKMGGW